MSDLGPGDRLGGYRVEAPVGEGGMGKVFRALRESDGEVVALKTIRTELAADEDHLRRFRREARAATLVSHPNLVPVVDSGEDAGRLFIAMRYVNGVPLSDRLADGALPVQEAIRIAGEIAAGLDALHEAGLVHRDVKPSNVLLEASGPGPTRALLTDFGLAKGRDMSIVTVAGQLLGTIDYLAPEVFRGEEPSPAADVYALGCVTFECLAGQPPFGGRSPFEVGMGHLGEPPGDACAERPDAPAGLGEAVRSALAKEPAARPPSARAFALLLESLASTGRSG